MKARRSPSGAAWLRGVLAMCLGAVQIGCAPWQTSAPVTPVSYQTSREQLPRTVGKLRRLAVVQLRLVPQGCAGGTDGAWQLTALDPTARELLAQRKGYELIEPDAAHPLADVGDPRIATSVQLVADLLAVKDATMPPGPALAAWLSQLREDERVDGVLVLKQEVACLKSATATRGLLALGTFGLSEVLPADFSQPMAEYLEVVVLETASARLVWRNVYGRLEQELVKPPMTFKGPVRGDALRVWSMTYVLKPLEPAVPRLLTR